MMVFRFGESMDLQVKGLTQRLWGLGLMVAGLIF